MDYSLFLYYRKNYDNIDHLREKLDSLYFQLIIYQ
ncbi:hypothetical protein BC781_11164 [Sediminitomix flava]|uniref:Uncharacterized protein n=1 Tax=Sediminitomix flava TaxID=379075 RepID=A0A315YWK7_SEDFL|nr:hypothetical protein BC781_11164 [Sediminitomix flava]